MRRVFFLVVFVIMCATGGLLATSFNVTKLGEWGNRGYIGIATTGNYAYCITKDASIDIINFSDTSKPIKSGEYKTPGIYYGNIRISGSYAYVVTGLEESLKSTLRILDISDPLKPVQIWADSRTFPTIQDFEVSGNYVYLGTEYGLYILNVSAPTSPVISYATVNGDRIFDLAVSGNYVYAYRETESLTVYNVSNPQAPTVVAQKDLESFSYFASMAIKGNTLCLSVLVNLDMYDDEVRFYVIDISNPASPTVQSKNSKWYSYSHMSIANNTVYASATRKGKWSYSYTLETIDISDPTNPDFQDSFSRITPDSLILGDDLLTASVEDGFKIFDISTPTSPTLKGKFDMSGNPNDVAFSGNYAYLVGERYQLQILDISNPTTPVRVGVFDPETQIDGSSIVVYKNYVLINTNHIGENYFTTTTGFHIIDVSNPSAPKRVFYDSGLGCRHFTVSGNYAYLVSKLTDEVTILDISNPANPKEVGIITDFAMPYSVAVKGDYAYVGFPDGLGVVKITNPAEPLYVGSFEKLTTFMDMKISGNYLYCISSGLITVMDISKPTQIRIIGTTNWGNSNDRKLYLQNNYLYDSCGNIFNISNPSNLQLEGSYEETQWFAHPYNGYIFASAKNFSVLQYKNVQATPSYMALNKGRMNFTAIQNGPYSGPQSFTIGFTSGNNNHWDISDIKPWVKVSATSGSGNAWITVTLDTSLINTSGDTAYGSLIVSSPDVVNSILSISIRCTMMNAGQTAPPFGEFATPQHNAIAYGSIPVTGWTLDDIGVQSIQIFRENDGVRTYIGDAVFVEGARPDVEMAYPGFPNNSRAGWGYMLLTNFLPNQGNGKFNLLAVATDMEGHQVTLGQKTIDCRNATAVKPFGAIDTPKQGGVVSGSDYVNFGWALTPQPNTIPIDGSTITVWVDGVALGHPVYNQYRKDIDNLFPGYNNSKGAVGYYCLDTSSYNNGVHTIQWSVKDNAGNSDGIGSRYFSIQNFQSRVAQTKSQRPLSLDEVQKIDMETVYPLQMTKGYDPEAPLKDVSVGSNGSGTIKINAMERVEIHFNSQSELSDTSDRYTGFQVVGDQLRELPVGSYLDPEKGIYYWQPGMAFSGPFHLVLIKTDSEGHRIKKEVTIVILQ